MQTSSFEHLTCFIAAEHGVERTQLRRRLEDRQVTCFSLDRELSSGGATVSVQSLIQRSDFVAGIFPPTPAPNVTFELGVALGLGKPLLLFAHRSSPVPFDLTAVNILQIDRLDQTNWNDYIEAFLRTVLPSEVSKAGARKHATIKGVDYARRWREIRNDFTRMLENPSSTFEKDLESLAQRAFKRGGFSLTSSPGPDFGADFAVASPKLIEAFSLPVLIEVKNNSQQMLEQAAANRLVRLIRERRGGAGLIVTAHETTDRSVPIGPIVIVSITELFDWLQRRMFEEQFLAHVGTFWTREQ
jgi:hypothetical protein